MGTPAFRDRYGLPLSTASAEAARHYVEGVDRHLSRNAGAGDCFRAAVAADPAFALAHAALVAQGGADALGADADAVAERLGALAGGASDWERRHVALVGAAIGGRSLRAALLAREQLTAHPRDVLALQRAIALIENGGRRDWPERRLALLDGVAAAYGEDWYFLGVWSRAHEEVGRFAEARRLAVRALAANPRSANAAHALAHVFYGTEEHEEGDAFLGAWLSGYGRHAPYHCHLSWHLALFALARGDHGRAMGIYERDIMPTGDDGRGRLLDAASLLWRWRLAGSPPASPAWEPVCRLADRWTGEAGRGSAVAHAALAYAANGEGAALDRLVDGLRRLDSLGDPLAGRVMLPLVQGIAAFAAGCHDETIRVLEPVVGEVVRIGGSYVQREVFEDTLLHAYLRAGRQEEAEALIRRRLERGGAMDRELAVAGGRAPETRDRLERPAGRA